MAGGKALGSEEPSPENPAFLKKGQSRVESFNNQPLLFPFNLRALQMQGSVYGAQSRSHLTSIHIQVNVTHRKVFSFQRAMITWEMHEIEEPQHGQRKDPNDGKSHRKGLGGRMGQTELIS